MNDRPTPETDAFQQQYGHLFPNWLASQFCALARRLERERDEWRKKAVELCAQRDKLVEALDLCLARLEHHTEFGALVQSDMSAMHSARQALAAMKGGKP